jgi:hypothetical protein
MLASACSMCVHRHLSVGQLRLNRALIEPQESLKRAITEPKQSRNLEGLPKSQETNYICVLIYYYTGAQALLILRP